MKKINIFSSRFFVESNNKYLFFIFGAVTFLVYSFLFCHVYAESGNIVQINFTSSPQTIDASSLSSVISIQTRNNLGELEKTSETTHIILHSSSPTGTFYNANASSCTTLIETPFVLKMNSGTANKNFCYKDATAGTHTLEISAEGKTWTSATQDVVINSLPTSPVEEPEFTEVSGVIGEDTTWTRSESPYVVTGPTFINEDVTLTIEPGVVVKFTSESNASLYVFGKIIANGEDGNEIHFTSNYDDIGGSTDEDYEDCNYENYDEEGNGIGEEVCTMLDWYEPNASDWDGLYFRNSSGSILDNVYIKYAHDAVSLESSDVNFKNINILNSFSGITGYNNSHVDILDGSINALNEDAFVFFTDSTLTIQGVSMIDVYNGFTIFGNSDLNIKDSSLSCSNDGFVFYDNSKLLLSQMNINCGHDGILLFNDVGADINEAKISGASDAGVISYHNTKPYLIKISNSEISNNEYGFIVWDSPFVAHQNSIYSNRSKGVETFFETPVDFSSNYWGDKTGPKNLSTNPLGLGNEVSDHVTYQPFLKNDPLKNVRNPVILIPGITGSYLYKDYDDKGEIWPGLLRTATGFFDNHLNILSLNKDGKENAEFPIKIGDVIRRVFIPLLGDIHVFDNFISDFEKEGYVENVDLFVFPYDWRFSTESTSELLKNKVDEILEKTGQEKVDIVAHSMGGLVTKKYIKNYGEEKIDQLIFLGTPQLGAPKAFKALMYGDSMGNKILSPTRTKFISQNMPSVYELLPSKKYEEQNGGYVVDALHKIINEEPVVLDYLKTKNLMIDKGRNSLMFPFAENLHADIDNLDLSHLKAYNIVGCGSPTIGEITMTQERSWKKLYLGLADDYRLKYVDGDETVPLISASKTIGAEVLYQKGVSHGALPDSEDVRQVVLSVLNNEKIILGDELSSTNSFCGIEGDVVSTHSPVELHIYDEEGKHTGLDKDGNMENGIKGVSIDAIENINYVFLPKGRNYKVVTKATDTGGFNLKIEEQNGGTITDSHSWNLIPLETLDAKGEIWVGPDYSSSEYSVKIDLNGDEVIDDNYKEGFDGTDLAEKATTKKEEKHSSSAVFGFIPKKDKNENWGGNNFVDKIKIEKEEDRNKKSTYNNNSKGILKDIKSENEEIKKIEIGENVLSASVGSIKLMDNKMFIIIASSILVLLLAIKLVFKIK